MAIGGCFQELVENSIENSIDKAIESNNEDENTCDFPLMIEREDHKRKIKWMGDLESLKSFVDCKLNLLGSWSYTRTNGGFYVFKASAVTLCFYPGTKTLNVQGAKQETVRKSICAVTEANNPRKIAEHVASQESVDSQI